MMCPLLLVGSIFLAQPALANDDSASRRMADQAALKSVAGLVGEWRGTGQPQRGSARGAWTESVVWSWKLSTDSAALDLAVANGKVLKGATLRPAEKDGEFTLEVILADGTPRAFRGKSGDKNAMVFLAQTQHPDEVSRITLTPLHETRFLLLLEAGGSATRPSRLAEVGYTRKGVAFASGNSAPVCVVTEGRGTIPVSHKGKTYYVCCSGCKALFEEDPEAILAEAKARTAGPSSEN